MKPTIYITANGLKSKLDYPISYDFSVYLENFLHEHNTSYNVVRLLPTSRGNTYVDQIAQVRSDYSAMFLVFCKCRPISGGKLPRTAPMLRTSSFDTTDFAGRLFGYLEFYTVDPRWLMTCNQQDYYLLKAGVTPVTLDLGLYDSVNDTKIITDNFKGVALSLSRALDLHHLITALQLYRVTSLQYCIVMVLQYHRDTSLR